MPPVAPGALALVLHTHMPYVEGHGTWPHGEEWLWEAAGRCYRPLLDVLERGGPADAVTLSVTPVLLDQLEAPGVAERYAAWVRDVRAETFRLDAAAADDPAVAAELERQAATDYPAALGELAARLAARADWTSSATHAVLPLVATDPGVRLQLATGVAAHRRRTGGWGGGLWLPECAHAPWLDEELARAGARVTCVEHTRLGLDPLVPLRTAAGVVLAPIDRPVVDLVWGRGGYPAGAAYRDSHRRTRFERRPWRNDGAVYDPAAAMEQVRADARDFVARVGERVAGGGLCVCALDTELLGDWWYEGVAWLAAVVETCAEAGVALVALDETAVGERAAPAPPELPVTTWGAGGDLRTWSSPQVARIAADQRREELNVLHAPLEGGAAHVRRLLALQASDWAFAITTGQAAPYAWERHAATLRGDDQRGLAPWATPAPLLVP